MKPISLRRYLLSLKYLLTVKLWQLCDLSNFIAKSRRAACCSGVIRYSHLYQSVIVQGKFALGR